MHPSHPSLTVTSRPSQHTVQSDVVYLDAKSDTFLEEVSSCNIFAVKGKTITTPPLAGALRGVQGSNPAPAGAFLSCAPRPLGVLFCGQRKRGGADAPPTLLARPRRPQARSCPA